jgi:hypothetical protein
MNHGNEGVPIGVQFIRWGLGLLVFGIFIGFGIIGHYVIGANHDTGDMFMKNVTLWFACPWTLAVYAVQAGSLGMIVIGTVYLALGRTFPVLSRDGQAGLWLCIAGLIAVFLTGYVGYFVVDRIWPSFYYTPIPDGKNAWLIAQAISISLYWLGVVNILLNVRKITRETNVVGTREIHA